MGPPPNDRPSTLDGLLQSERAYHRLLEGEVMSKGKSKDPKVLTDLHTIYTYEFLFTAAHMASADADEAEEDHQVFEYTERFNLRHDYNHVLCLRS